MVSLPKINLGRKSHRNYFNLQHDVEATCGFGYCTPTINRMFMRGSEIDLNTRSFVRLAPLPVPTFGRIEVKTHTAFCPMNDIFPAWDYMQAQKAVSSAVRSYTPQTVDYIEASTFRKILYDMSLRYPSFNVIDSIQKESVLKTVPFKFAVFASLSDVAVTDGMVVTDHDNNNENFQYVDVLNDERLVCNSDSRCAVNGFSLAAEALELIYGRESSELYMGRHYSCSPADKGAFVEDDNWESMFPLQSFLRFVPNRYVFPSVDGATEIFGFPNIWQRSGWRSPQNSGFFNYNGISSDLDNYARSVLGILNNRNSTLPVFEPFSFDSCDFIFPLAEPSELSFLRYNADGEWNPAVNSQPVYLGIKCTPFGKRLISRVLACAHMHLFDNENKSLLPLLANYKVWFDKYNPGRNIQWKETNAFKIIHSYYDTGLPCESLFTFSEDVETSSPFNSQIINTNRRKWFIDFLIDLGDMYYTLPIDNMTAATTSPLMESDETGFGMQNMLFPFEGSGAAGTAEISTTDIYGNVDNLTQSGSTLNALSLKVLERIYPLVNKNSAVKSKIEDYLRVHGIETGLPESNVLNESRYMCNIDDVFSTAETGDGYLGEYAGKGVGTGQTGKIKFEAKTYGWLIQLVTIVPIGGYCQGTERPLINRYDFYQSEFDSLGMQSMRYHEFLGRNYFFDDSVKDSSTFGFVPRYFNLKVANNTSLGDFALRGSQALLLPYTMNRVFNVQNVKQYPFGVRAETLRIVADESLRYIGRDENFGNYDRIFYDTTGMTDNFILHIIQDLTMHAPMKAVSDSWDTFDKDVDDDSVKAELA